MNWPAFCKGILLGLLIPIAAYLPTGWPGFLWQIPLLVIAATALVLLDKWDFHMRPNRRFGNLPVPSPVEKKE